MIVTWLARLSGALNVALLMALVVVGCERDRAEDDVKYARAAIDERDRSIAEQKQTIDATAREIDALGKKVLDATARCDRTIADAVAESDRLRDMLGRCQTTAQVVKRLNDVNAKAARVLAPASRPGGAP